MSPLKRGSSMALMLNTFACPKNLVMRKEHWLLNQQT
jgi:hypothetical protein